MASLDSLIVSSLFRRSAVGCNAAQNDDQAEYGHEVRHSAPAHVLHDAARRCRSFSLKQATDNRIDEVGRVRTRLLGAHFIRWSEARTRTAASPTSKRRRYPSSCPADRVRRSVVRHRFASARSLPPWMRRFASSLTMEAVNLARRTALSLWRAVNASSSSFAMPTLPASG